MIRLSIVSVEFGKVRNLGKEKEVKERRNMWDSEKEETIKGRTQRKGK